MNLKTFLAAFALWAWAGAAAAFHPVINPERVVEYYNPQTNRYLLVTSHQERIAVERGGWFRTGFEFSAESPPSFHPLCTGGPDCPAIPIRRFYHPGLNTHLYTGFEREIEAVSGPGQGWIDEGVAFHVARLVDGGCQSFQRVPIYRLYNNRAAFFDTHHRYVHDPAVRERMIAAGWVDEGTYFCAFFSRDARYDATWMYESDISGVSDVLGIRTPEACTGQYDSCLAAVNFGRTFSVNDYRTWPLAFRERTGLNGLRVLQTRGGPPEEAAMGTFVQPHTLTVGLHLNGSERADPGSPIASLSPFHAAPQAPGAPDERVFPFRQDPFRSLELRLAFTLNVGSFFAEPGGRAYGIGMIEFVDAASGKPLLFGMQAFGNHAASEVLEREAGTGKAALRTVAGRPSRFGRSTGTPVLQHPSPLLGVNAWGWGGPFELRIDRGEFQNIVNEARRLDPGFSADISTYYVANFQVRNETLGAARSGINVDRLQLEQARR